MTKHLDKRWRAELFSVPLLSQFGKFCHSPTAWLLLEKTAKSLLCFWCLKWDVIGNVITSSASVLEQEESSSLETFWFRLKTNLFFPTPSSPPQWQVVQILILYQQSANDGGRHLGAFGMWLNWLELHKYDSKANFSRVWVHSFLKTCCALWICPLYKLMVPASSGEGNGLFFKLSLMSFELEMTQELQRTQPLGNCTRLHKGMPHLLQLCLTEPQPARFRAWWGAQGWMDLGGFHSISGIRSWSVAECKCLQKNWR